jgi:hypothetical protein
MNTKQCKGCIYWRNLYQGHNTVKSPWYACHYLIDNMTPRKRDGDTCYSRKLKDGAKEDKS